MSTTLSQLPDTLASATATKGSSLRRDTVRNILRQRSAIVGLTILTILFLTAIFAPLIATHDPIVSLRDLGETNITRGDPPCIHALGCALDKPEHLFGIDAVIRDEFSRVVYGARISLQVGFITVGFAIILGSFIGAIAGFFGGWSDNVLMRIMDVVLSFPSLVLAIAIVTVLGPGLINAQLAIGIVSIPIYARVMRASVLSVREADFVTASRALGESSAGILSRRILPNALTPLIVQGTLGIGGAILEVAALSFLGLGAQQPEAEWGSMIALDRSLFFSAPHLIFFPGLAITFTVLGFNLLGDGIRDALDPRLNR
ncbi:MAG: peptide/nickel transport system permease protein [Chloroflexota bacterium]|jgi:ABC-type dipeptide/oligopeptide/nickel transport system permease subunit|nr:peptide/nickel transport system permease protein [Chloroflexota bacterium]